MLRNRQTNETHKRKNIKDLELMMIEIIKSNTSLMNAQTLDLQFLKR